MTRQVRAQLYACRRCGLLYLYAPGSGPAGGKGFVRPCRCGSADDDLVQALLPPGHGGGLMPGGKLKELLITKVGLVDAGDNPRADILRPGIMCPQAYSRSIAIWSVGWTT